MIMDRVIANRDTVRYEKQLQYELNLVDSWSVAFHLTFKRENQRNDVYGSGKRNSAVLRMISKICKQHKLRYSDLIIFIKEEEKNDNSHIHGLIGGFKGYHNLGDYINRDAQLFFKPKNVCDAQMGNLFKKEIENYWSKYIGDNERRIGECCVRLITEKEKQVNYAAKVSERRNGDRVVVMRNMFCNQKLENIVTRKLGRFRKHCKQVDKNQIVKWVPHL